MEVSEKFCPGTPVERARIEKAGGWVTEEKELFVSRVRHMPLQNEIVRKYAERSMRWLVTYRVNGELAVSRALGDPDYKGEGMAAYPWFFNDEHPKCEFTEDLVIADPILKEVDLCEDDEFLMLACDGQ